MNKYNLKSNFNYVFTFIWKKRKLFIFEILLEMILSVLVPLMGVALSALIVKMLSDKINYISIIICISFAFTVYAMINGMKTFYYRKNFGNSIESRLALFSLKVLNKYMNIPLKQAESAKIIQMKAKANIAISENWAGIEGMIRNTIRLSVSALGLLVYVIIIGNIQLSVMLLMLGVSVIGTMICSASNCYYNKIKDRIVKERITMEYIDRIAEDSIAGKDIRVFGQRDWIVNKYKNSVGIIKKLNFKRDVLEFLGNMICDFLDAFRSIVCCVYLIKQLQCGMLISEFVFLIGVINGFSIWFEQIGTRIVNIRQCSKEISDFRKFIDYGGENKEDREILNSNFEKIDIEFKNVSFKYEESDVYILKNISFTIKQGEHKALVGLNGAGKSTIVKLIAGLYLPTEGEIYVNGVSTKEIDINTYFSHEAVVFQENFLTSYTIAENIALSEEWNETKIWNCLSTVGLKNKIYSLPNGINTYLGKDIAQSGVALSGGECQKILLARALYKNPSSVILDEPTASLDAIAETEIYEIYNTVLKDITSLFVSHRLASTKFCEEIIVLSNGQISERGSHERLMQDKGDYYSLFKVQSKYYDDNTFVEEEN